MENYQVQFRDLLKRAVSEPGTISAAYSAFHNYSIGNQLAALFQCWLRQIPVGPIATLKDWNSKGRYVKRGEKAIWLCMPITGKKAVKDYGARDNGPLQILCLVVWKRPEARLHPWPSISARPRLLSAIKPSRICCQTLSSCSVGMLSSRRF